MKKFLKILGWIIVPFIMIFIQWKRLNKGVKVIGIVWALIMLLLFTTGFHGNPPTAAEKAATPTAAPIAKTTAPRIVVATPVPTAVATAVPTAVPTPAPTQAPIATPDPLSVPKMVTLGAGMFNIGYGADILQGRYVVSTKGTMGNFVVRNSMGDIIVNELLGTDPNNAVNDFTVALPDGGNIQISGLNAVKFTPKT